MIYQYDKLNHYLIKYPPNLDIFHLLYYLTFNESIKDALIFHSSTVRNYLKINYIFYKNINFYYLFTFLVFPQLMNEELKYYTSQKYPLIKNSTFISSNSFYLYANNFYCAIFLYFPNFSIRA